MPSVRWPTEGQATAACEHRACSARAPRLPSDPFKFNFNNFRARFFFHPSSRGCPSPMFWYVGLRSSAAGDIMPSERRSMPCGGPQPPPNRPRAFFYPATPQTRAHGAALRRPSAPWVGRWARSESRCSVQRRSGSRGRATRCAERGPWEEEEKGHRHAHPKTRDAPRPCARTARRGTRGRLSAI